MNYYVGFSLRGFFIVLLPMIPNFFYFLFPKAFPSGKQAKHPVLNWIEHGMQAVFIALLLFLVGPETSFQSPIMIGIVLFLISYYALWILLLMNRKTLLVLLCMAVFPVVYFLLAEIWIQNVWAIAPTLIFGIAHVRITYKDYQTENTRI